MGQQAMSQEVSDHNAEYEVVSVGVRPFRWWCQRKGLHRWMEPIDEFEPLRICGTCWHQERRLPTGS